MPPPSSPPEFSGNPVPDNDQNNAGGEPDAIDRKLEELQKLHQAPQNVPAAPINDVGSVSKNRQFATRLAIIIAAIFVISASALTATVFLTQKQPQSPNKPAVVEPLNETVAQPSVPLPPESLSVTTLSAQAASISALNVSGSASIQGNLSVNGQGTFGGTIQAANFQGSGAGLTGVNASLLGGHPASFFTGLANSISGAALLSGNNTFTGANTFISTLSAGSLSSNSVTAGSLTSLGTITANSMTLGQPLSVTNGGIGLSNVPTAAILYGQGGPTLGVATPPSAGLCLLSGTNSDTWGSCSGAIPGVATLDNLSGLLAIADSTGAGTTVTINDASTTQKGIAQFNATDFLSSAGVIDTSQSLAVTAAPTFAGLTLSSPLTVSSGGTGSASLTANGVLLANGTNALSSLTAGAAGECLLSTAGAPVFGTCPGSAGAGGVSSLGGTANKLAKFTGAQTIGNSSITDTGSSVSITPAANNASVFQVQNAAGLSVLNIDTSGNIATFGNVTATIGQAIAGALRLSDGTADNFGATLNSTTLSANRTITIPDASGQICLTTGNCSGIGGVIGGAGTAGVIPVFTGASTIGNSALSATASSLTFTPTVDSVTAFQIQNAATQDVLAVDTQNGRVAIGGPPTSGAFQVFGPTQVGYDNSVGAFGVKDAGGGTEFGVDTVDHEVAINSSANATAGTPLINSDGLVLADSYWNGSSPANSVFTVQNVALSTAPTYELSFINSSSNTVFGLQGNGAATFENSTDTSSAFQIQNAAGNSLVNIDSLDDTTTFGNITGSAGHGVAGAIKLADGTSDNFGATLNTTALTASQTITIPNASGQICLTSGNCTGLGGSVGGTGTTNKLAKFTAANTIADSSISDTGSSVTISPSSNSTSGFQIQNAGGGTLFNVDTTNNQLTEGTSATNSVGDTSSGTNTLGSIYWNGSQQGLTAQSFTTTNGGALSSMSTYIGAAGISGTNNLYQMAIYSDNAGLPGSYLASTAVGTLSTPGWNSLPITATLAPKTTYWMVYWTNVQDGTNNGQNYFNEARDITNAYVWNTFENWQCSSGCGSQTNGLPNNYPTSGINGTNGLEVSIYATYANNEPAINIDSSGNQIVNGTALFQAAVNSPTALLVNTADNQPVLQVDTTINAVGVNMSPNGNFNLSVRDGGGGNGGGEEIVGQSYQALDVLDGSNVADLQVNTNGDQVASADLTVGNVNNIGGAGLLVSDNFESGNFSLWSGGSSGGASIDTSTAHSGKYSAEINVSSSTGYARTNFSSTATTFTVNTWFQWHALPGSGELPIITLYQASNPTNKVELYIASDWHLGVINGTNDLGEGNALVGNDAWTPIALTINRTTGEITINDGQAIWNTDNDYTGLTIGAGWDTLQIGASTASTGQYWLDDVALTTGINPSLSNGLVVQDALHASGSASFGGSVLVQPAADSTDAFQVENTASVDTLSVDTTATSNNLLTVTNTSTNNNASLLTLANSDGSAGIQISTGGTSGAGNNAQDTYVGYQSGENNTLNTTSHQGQYNTALGYDAIQGASGMTASYDTGVGYAALQGLTSGQHNTALGNGADQGNQNGNENTGIGAASLSANQIGNDNTALGYEALNNTGASGAASNFNTAVGAGSLYNNISGSNNVAIGFASGQGNPNATNTAGSDNVFIGYQAGTFDGGGFLTPNSLQNSAAIGYQAQVQASNSLILGGAGAEAVNVGIGTTIPESELSVSPVAYNTGTAAVTSTGTTITGTGTNWTSAMVGDEFIFATGQEGLITAVTNQTSLTVATTQAVISTPLNYRIQLPGLEVAANGTAGLGMVPSVPSGAELAVTGQSADNSSAALQVTNAAGTNIGNFLNDGTVDLGGNSSTATYGFDTLGSTVGTGFNNMMSAQKITATSNGTLTSISTYINPSVDASPNNVGQLALYADSAGAPGNYIASSTSFPEKNGTWNSLPVATLSGAAPTVAAGTSYWLIYWTKGGSGGGQDNGQLYTPGIGTWDYVALSPGTYGTGPDNGMLASFGAPSGGGAYAFSIYATVQNNGQAEQLAGSNGAATFQNTANSTAAFQVQSAAGADVVDVDTTNTRLSVGSIGTAVGQLYVGGSTPSGAYSTFGSGDFYQGKLAVSGSYAYIAEYGSNHITVMDISNPASPSSVSSTGISIGNPANITVQGRYAYISANNATGNNFEIADISNPKTPTFVSRLNLAGSQQTGPMVIQGRYVYLEWNDNASNDYLSVIDVSNPFAPTIASTFHLATSLISVGSFSGMQISGKYLYVTFNQTSGTGLQVFDTSNPYSLSSVGTLAIGTATAGLYQPNTISISGRYAYVSGVNTPHTGQVVDISDPTNPSVVASFADGNGPVDSVVQGNRLFVMDYNTSGIQEDDISNPLSPSFVATLYGPPNANSIAVQGRYLYGIGYANTPSFIVDDLGGTYTQQLQAGAIQTSDLAVTGNQQNNGNLSVLGGIGAGQLDVQGDAGIGGNMSVYGGFTQQDTTASQTAFQIQSATETVLDVDTINNRVGIGTTAPTAPLDVVGQGSTNLTFASVIRNANGNDIAKFRNDGAVDLGQSSSNVFGDTTVEPTLDGGSGTVVTADRFITPNAGATVTSMSIYIGPIDPTSADDKFKLGIYSDNNGSPGSFISGSVQGTLTANSWNSLSVSASLTGNTYYWLAYITNGSAPGYNDPVYQTTSSPTHAYANNTYTSGFPGSMTGATVNDYYHSIYATLSNGYIAGLTVGANGNVGIGTGDTTPPTANLTVQTQQNNTAAFQVQNSSGTSAFNVDTQNNITDIPSAIVSTGTAQFQNGTNSTGAFKIQDTASDTLFNVDTQNVAVSVGQSVGPLGYTTVGGTASGASNNHMNARKITTTNAGSLVSVSVYFDNTDAAPNNKYQVALYSDSSGAPGSLLASSSSDNTITPGAWNIAPLSYSLAATTSYWLVANDNSTSNVLGEIAFDSLGTDHYASITQTYGTWPGSYGTPTTSNTNSESMYGNVDYGAAIKTNSSGNVEVNNNLDTTANTGLAIGNNNATSISLGNTTSNIQTTINGTELVKPTSGHDSATTFQVNSAGGANLLTVDSTGSHVLVGGTAVCSGVPNYGRFCVGNNLSGVGAGATNVNSNNVSTTALTSGSADTVISQKAIQNDTSSNTIANTLQGYIFDASGTTDTADSITAIQAMDPAANSGNLLNLQSCSGVSCATVATVAKVSNTGAATFENQANSSAAFQVQNAGNISMFTVDTSADHIVIGSGSTGEASPVLLVLDNGTSASDPTGVNGAIYYSTALNRFRCYENGEWKSCIGIDEDNQRQSPNESTDFMGPGNAGVSPWSLIAVPTGTGGTFGHVTGVPNHPGIVFLGSLAANGPNTGYSVTNYTIAATGIDTIDITGGESWELVFSPSTLDANTTSYMGFIDNNTGVAPTNGIYLSLSNTTMTGVGVSGGTSTLTGTTDTLTAGHWYRARVVVNPSATAATFTVTDLTASSTWTDSVSSHIPSLVGDGVESTYATAATHQLLSLDYMAFWYTGVSLNR